MTRKEALKIAKTIKAAEGMIPYDGDYSNGDHNFKWFRVEALVQWNALCVCFKLQDYQRESVAEFPEWVCIEDDNCSIDFDTFSIDGDSNGIRITTLQECQNAFNKLVDSLQN